MVDFVALVTPPILVGPNGEPAQGKIYAHTTNTFALPGVLVVPYSAQGLIKDGAFTKLDGSPYLLPVTPEGGAIELVAEIFQDVPGGQRTKHYIRRTVATPNASTVTWDALTDVVPVAEGGDYVLPSWAASLDAKATEAIVAAEQVALDRVATEAAAAEAAAFGGTNNTQVAGMVTEDGPTKAALTATIAAATEGFVEQPTRPAVDLATLPTLVQTTWGFNAGPQVTTANGYEYVVYARSDAKIVITRRKIGRTEWETPVELTAILGAQAADGHNFTSIAISSDGRIHISGNYHDQPLKYAVSNEPYSIQAGFSAGTMVGTDENSMTYPEFFNAAGNVYFIYRNGASGAGDTFLNRYANGVWTRVARLFVGSGESVYTARIAVSPTDGSLNLAYNWRGGPLPYTNHDICFVKSTDGGVTWKSVTGTPVALPITVGTSPIVHPTTPTNSGLINSPACDVDSNGHPHIASLIHDSNGKHNVLHMWHDGTTWREEFVTFGTHVMSLATGTIDAIVGRPYVACSRNGRTFILWRTMADGKRGTFWGIDASTPGSPVEIPLANVDLYYAEPGGVDIATLRRDGILKILITPAAHGGGPTVPAYGDADNWVAQWGGVLSVDLDGLNRAHFDNGLRPGTELISSNTISRKSATAVTSATIVDDTTAEETPLHRDALPKTTLIQMVGRYNSQDSAAPQTSHWMLSQKNITGGNISRRAVVSFTSVGNENYMLTSPMVPVEWSKLTDGVSGFLSVQAKVTGVGTRATMLAVRLLAIRNSDGRLL